MKRNLEQTAHETITYYLTSLKNETGHDGFMITLVTNDDFASAYIRADRETARACLNLVAKHAVMPCTLKDILEDLSIPHSICDLQLQDVVYTGNYAENIEHEEEESLQDELFSV